MTERERESILTVAKKKAWEWREAGLAAERDWLIDILSKERTGRVNFSYHCAINLQTSRLPSL